MLCWYLCSTLCFVSGVLLPGDAVKFPFIFKSPNAGIFSEQWEFQTHPVVCGGAKLLVTLRGVALKQDKYEVERTELEVVHRAICHNVLLSLCMATRTKDVLFFIMLPPNRH